MLNADIFADRERIRDGLKQPFLILPDAFLPEVAQTLYTDLQTTKAWCPDNFENELYKYERDKIPLEALNAPSSLTRLYDYLRSPEMLNWFSAVSGRPSDGFVGFAGHFRGGHQLTRHNDMLAYADKDGDKRSRTIAFNYYLARNWQSSWGGQLVWEKPYAEIVPKFNTLVLFVVSPTSMHWVKPVDWAASEKRFSITGWYTNSLSNRASSVKKLKLDLS